MTLDLSNDNGGKLSYLIDTKEEVQVAKDISNVAVNDIDINNEYRLAVTMWYARSMLALLP